MADDSFSVVRALTVEKAETARKAILARPDTVEKLNLLHGLEGLVLRRVGLRHDKTSFNMADDVWPKLEVDQWKLAFGLRDSGHDVPARMNRAENVSRVLAERDLAQTLSPTVLIGPARHGEGRRGFGLC